jgi:hypothetical protein
MPSLDAALTDSSNIRICRELGNIEGLAPSLANQVIIFAQQGRRMEASRVIDDALSLATKGDYTPLAAQIREMKEH